VSARNTTVQLLELVVAGASVHGSGVTLASDPAGWLVKLKSTVPAGALFVPSAVSVTVTTQLTGLFAGVESGQTMLVEVLRAVTLIVSLPELAVWSVPDAGL
jgi:hypothetical protein